QKLTADALQISPLVEQLGTANVPEKTQKLIHRDKAQAILATKLLNQFDVVSAITHFMNAGDPTEAAKVLFACLNALDGIRTENAEDFGVLGILTTIEFQ